MAPCTLQYVIGRDLYAYPGMRVPSSVVQQRWVPQCSGCGWPAAPGLLENLNTKSRSQTSQLTCKSNAAATLREDNGTDDSDAGIKRLCGRFVIVVLGTGQERKPQSQSCYQCDTQLFKKSTIEPKSTCMQFTPNYCSIGR